MHCAKKICSPIVNSFKIQFKKMYSNIKRPLEGKIAIITASTDG